MDLSELIGPVEYAKAKPAHLRRAILWGGDDLLAEVVGSLFDSTAWDVTRSSNNGEVEDLICAAKRIHPEVIVLCQDKADADPALPLRLIHEELCTKVITLGMDSNLVQVYCKQNIMLEGSSDLVSVIESGRSPGCILGKEVRTTTQIP